MNGKHKVLAIIPAIALGIACAIPALALDTRSNPPVSASTSMNQAGEDTQGAVQNAYVGMVTALRDTAITAEIKAAFVSEMDIRSFDIHVTTTAGVVTLDGHVPNSDMAARVEAIAKNTEGVRDVANNLRVSPSASQN